MHDLNSNNTHPTSPGSRLYIVVRSDLSPGAQLAQACHAISDFVAGFPTTSRQWLDYSHSLVVVAVPSETELRALAHKAHHADVEHVLFTEPDLAGEATALALAPTSASRVLCANLPLAGRCAVDPVQAQQRERMLKEQVVMAGT